MVGSMNAFEIYSSSKTDVVFVLKYYGASEAIVQHTYSPNGKGSVTVDVKDIILPLLSLQIKDESTPYEQPDIKKSFVAKIYEVGHESEAKVVIFAAIRAGVDRLSDSADNFLKSNFLTWQPQVKAVTYYSPEFLTYYAVEDCEMKCKAYIWNGTGYDEKTVQLALMEAGNAYTVPVQYAIIAKAIGGDILPSYYDVWVEQEGGDRLTYIQRYYADDMKSEEEEWFLFENSLGGIDCFRAYGNSENTAEHTHNVAEIEDDSEEYRVDTTRKFKKNTGFLDKKERQWLLDFFPSLGKYVYQGSSLRKITVIESDVSYEAKELPSSYSFTYRYSDARPYLNLSRAKEGSFKQMDIHLPDLGNFTIAPRLVECSRLTLSGGALFPVQNPYSEEWGVTTLSAILTQLMEDLSDTYTGGGGVGHKHSNIELLEALNELNGYLTYRGNKLKAGTADVADDFSENGKASKKILRKDIEDVASALIKFAKGAKFGDFVSGMTDGKGALIDEKGNAEVESITVRSSVIAKELIVNRQTAMESNFVFTESGLIESVSEIPSTSEGGNTTYLLGLQKRWEGDFTAFRENDVVLASINTLAENGKYYDMWLRVLSVNTVANTITVVCYPDSEVSSGKNHPPCELARLIRWGNAVDEDRQSCWYISSSEGLLVWLDHVTKPIIDKTNYSLALGKLPDALSFLFQDFPNANKRDGAFYAKWMMAESFQQIDYLGNPIYTTRDRGAWSLAVAQGKDPYRNGEGVVDTVYYLGCKWKCLEDKTTKPPTYSSTAWAFVEGNPFFTLEMKSSKLWSFRLTDLMQKNEDGSWKAFTTLSVTGRLYNQNVTDSMVNVVWSRDSGDVDADNKWTLAHANCGLSVDLTYEDLGSAAYRVGSVTFRCDAEIKDGETMYAEDVNVVF